jgi:hypothetical protein
MATMTLEDARNIVRGLTGPGSVSRLGLGRRNPIRPPNTGGGPDLFGDEETGAAPPPTGGIQPPLGEGATGLKGSGEVPTGFIPVGPEAPGYFFDPRTGEIGRTSGGYAFDEFGNRSGGFSFTTLSETERKRFLKTLGATPDGSPLNDTGTADTGPDYLNLARQKYGSDEQQRAFENQLTLQQLANAQRQYDDEKAQTAREFGLQTTVADRNELGQRANTGLSLADLYRETANDPGNYPAYLESLINSGNVQGVVGANTQIRPEARFGDLLAQLSQYSGAMNTNAPAVRQAYEQNPQAAESFFRQDPENLRRMFGPKAFGGSFLTQGPMKFQDLRSGTTGIAGEAGPEQVTIQPSQPPSSIGNAAPQLGGVAAPRQQSATSNFTPGSAGTFQAIGRALASSGFGSQLPGVLEKLARGEAPLPGEVPDWLLQRLEQRTPSLVALLKAGITSRLGATGAGDYFASRSLYDIPGFNGTTQSIAR